MTQIRSITKNYKINWNEGEWALLLLLLLLYQHVDIDRVTVKIKMLYHHLVNSSS